MGQTSRISTNNTKVTHNAEGWSVQLHNTVIVRREGNTIHIDTGGWNTVTTRGRINQVSNEMGLHFGVGCRNGELFLWFHTHTAQGMRNMAHYIVSTGDKADKDDRFFFDQKFSFEVV